MGRVPAACLRLGGRTVFAIFLGMAPMCGIIGLLIKKPEERDSLGELLAPMIVCMNDRGPDSAGLAVFGSSSGRRRRFSLYASDPEIDFAALAARFTRDSAIPAEISIVD